MFLDILSIHNNYESLESSCIKAKIQRNKNLTFSDTSSWKNS